jgi:hypothetical protein
MLRFAINFPRMVIGVFDDFEADTALIIPNVIVKK